MRLFLVKGIVFLFFLLSAVLSCSQENVVTLNKEIPGNTTNDSLKRVEQDVISEKPDIVILMVGQMTW